MISATSSIEDRPHRGGVPAQRTSPLLVRSTRPPPQAVQLLGRAVLSSLHKLQTRAVAVRFLYQCKRNSTSISLEFSLATAPKSETREARAN